MGTVVVLGSTIIDLVARAPRLPVPGEAVLGDDFSTFLEYFRHCQLQKK